MEWLSSINARPVINNRKTRNGMSRVVISTAAGAIVGLFAMTTLPSAEQPTESRSALPLIGEDAPAFKAQTTQGPISFPEDFKGKWVLLFSHPADFTPVCTTEFMTFAKMTPALKKLNCELVGLSVDSIFSHIAWLRTIKEKLKYKDISNAEPTFPLIADITMEVARKYGMIQALSGDTATVRAVFFIDPQAKVRALIYYPRLNGRNTEEIKRLLIAMQTTDKFQCATPADWQPGDDVIIPMPTTTSEAKERVEKAGKDYECLDWFFCFKKLPKEQLKLP